MKKTEIPRENHRVAISYYQVSLVTDWNETRNCIDNRNWLHRKCIQLSMITAIMASYIKHIIYSMYLLCVLNYIVTFSVCDILHTPENIYLVWVSTIINIKIVTSPVSDMFHITEKVSLSWSGFKLHNCSHRILGSMGMTYKYQQRLQYIL